MKNTMKAALVLALSLALNSSFAQCTKKKDDMTGQVTVETKREKLGAIPVKGLTPATYLESSMSYVAGTYILYLSPEFNDIQTIKEGSEVLIKFEDESLMKLTVDKTSISEHGSGKMFTQSNTIWYNFLAFTLNSDDVSKLKSKKITKIRAQFSDYIVKGKSQDLIPGWIDCIEKSK